MNFLFCPQEVVLSSEQDLFFKANMYENFGDLGMNIKRMVDEFQQVAKSNQNIQTIGAHMNKVIHLYKKIYVLYYLLYLHYFS